MRVVTVLRQGREYGPRHAQALHQQITEWLPCVDAVCLSDVDVPGVRTVPLRHDWPGWWSKMELFRPDLTGDILYMDLDTVIVGPLDDIAAVRSLTLLRDFYKPGHLGSGVMFLPEADRAEVWEAWMTSPQEHMRRHRKGGDQKFLETLWLDKAARWQDVLPGQVVSYKVDIRKHGDKVPHGTRVVAFHGKPRPWALTKELTF